MTHFNNFFEKDFIGSWSLPDGKDVTVTISEVKGGTLTGVGGRKTKKPIVYMVGTKKGLAINATNAKTIAGMYGNHVEEWAGKRITLFKTTTQFGSETMDCLRIRPQIPQAKGANKDEPKLSEGPPPEPPEMLGDDADADKDNH